MKTRNKDNDEIKKLIDFMVQGLNNNASSLYFYDMEETFGDLYRKYDQVGLAKMLFDAYNSDYTEQFLSHNPEYVCEMLCISEEDAEKYDMDRTYHYNIYIYGKKVNDNIYRFSSYDNDISDNKSLNEHKFVVLNRCVFNSDKAKTEDIYHTESVIIDTSTGHELPFPIHRYGQYKFSKCQNFMIVSDLYGFNKKLVFLPRCIFVLPDVTIDKFWETETCYFIHKQKNDEKDYDTVYQVDKETGNSTKL